MMPNANQHYPVWPCFLTEFLKIAPPLAMLSSVATDARMAETASGNGSSLVRTGMVGSASNHGDNINHTGEC
jgi:hypothetical protein